MNEELVNLIPPALFGVLIGWGVGYLFFLKGQLKIREEKASLQALLESERKNHQFQLEQVEKNKLQLTDTFSALAGRALKSNNEEFLKLAKENLSVLHTQAKGELQNREKSIEGLIKPIKEALNKTEKELHRIETERKEAYGFLHKHLETMTQTQQALHMETRNLVKALRRPEVRGQWGELTLKRLAELAGMVEHCDFFQQESTQSETGRQRPDMVIRMPEEREVVVDVKTPLDAYLNAVESNSDEEKEQYLQQHLRQLRDKVRELSSKAYWQQFKRSPEFVILFIPGDQFLSAALDRDSKLMEDALYHKVILATPSSFVAILRAIAYGWRQLSLAKNAEQVQKVGEQLYHRVAVLAGHLNKLGTALDSSVKNYNKAIGSFERQIIPSTRKFKEMGIQSKKEIDDLEPIESSSRLLEEEI